MHPASRPALQNELPVHIKPILPSEHNELPYFRHSTVQYMNSASEYLGRNLNVPVPTNVKQSNFRGAISRSH